MTSVAGALLAAAAFAGLQGGDRLTARTVVARVHAYVDRYFDRLATVVGEESAVQRVIDAGHPQGVRNEWRADFAVVRSDDGAWLALRDVFEHAGQVAPTRGELTTRLFSAGRAGIGVSARRIADEGARVNSGGRRRNFNTPVFGLALLASDRRAFVRTRAMRVKSVDGIERWQVRVEERDRPTLVREENGAPVFSSVVFDISPETGAILGYEAAVGRTSPIRLVCRFGRHEALDMLVPERLEETFTEPTHAFVGVHTYTNWRKFEVTSRVVP